MSERNKSIGLAIKLNRQNKGLTQQQLADMIGKNINSLKKYEAGTTNVPLKVLETIAYQLDVSIIELIGETEAIENGLIAHTTNANLNRVSELSQLLKISNEADIDRVRDLLFPKGIPQEPVDYFREVLRSTLGVENFDSDKVSDQQLLKVFSSQEFKIFMGMLLKSMLND